MNSWSLCVAEKGRLLRIGKKNRLGVKNGRDEFRMKEHSEG
jgi:hypothetical protein